MMSDTVLHVLVVGFHHKKGCVVEYATPPLITGQDSRSGELPAQWKHLPSLALPDGSHNYDSDTCFFHLPDLENPRKTVFGISCYRQIDASMLTNKTDDITRASVQKSVCVLSRLPLYGHIQVKMSLITEAYFREGDFQRLDLIDETLTNLNACLSDEMLRTQQLYVGLSARTFVQQLKQRALILFKLLLLEKKVLLYQSPVVDLSSFLLTLLSLHPGMLENGLDEASCVVPTDTPPSLSPDPSLTFPLPPTSSNSEAEPAADKVDPSAEEDLNLPGFKTTENDSSQEVTATPEDEPKESSQSENFSKIAQIPIEHFGLPLKVFTGGNLCHPYVSLSYLDNLTQPSVHGYMIGATNVLFVQKKGLADVVIEIDKDRFDVQDPELKKALHLTTEDLRFTDNLVKHVGPQATSGGMSTSASFEAPDVFLDGIGWEGGDEWVRAQFRFYLVSLLRTCMNQDSGNLQHFNSQFVEMWKETKNYREWRHFLRTIDSSTSEKLCHISPRHPYAGNHGLSVTDVKLHLSNTITNTEGGKRVTQAVANTGRAVAGGISTAKGALSSWITSFKTPPTSSQATVESPDSAEHKTPECEAEKAVNGSNKTENKQEIAVGDPSDSTSSDKQ